MKTKLSISMDRETLEQIISQIDSGRFRNKSHAIEFAVKKLLEAENGDNEQKNSG